MMKYVEESSTGTHSVGYTYDNINNLTKLVETINGVERSTSYTYDEDNRPTSISTNGTSRTYTYDAFSRVSKDYTILGDTELFNRSYIYKAPSGGGTSNVLSRISYSGTNLNRSFMVNRDANGNIHYALEGTYINTYEYDSANQLIRENHSIADTTTIWTYDSAGNILTREVYPRCSGTPDPATRISLVNYTYNDDKGWGDLLTAYNGVSITHDEIGNSLNDGTWTYTWQHGRQLASMTKIDQSEAWQFTYNADGMRTQRKNTVTDRTYNYTYLGDQLTHMTVDGHTMYFAYDAAGTPMAMTYDGANYYYVTNIQGDVIFILDNTGTELVRYIYDAWGNLISTDYTEAAKDAIGNVYENIVELGFYNPLRYRGYVYDAETGLYYLQSRYYDPEMGRFINGDGYASTGQGVLGNNMFAYCGNNPVRSVDISGTRYCEATTVAGEIGDARSEACQFQNKAALEKQNTKNLMAFYGVTSPNNIPEMPDGAMLFSENITSVSISGPLAIVRGQTVVMDRYKYCVYNFAGVGLSAALVSIPVDHTITAGYVYGLNTVTDYCGAFMGGSSNLLLDVAGEAVACNGVYAEIIGGHNYVPSHGLSITNYTTTQTNWIYGPANITFLPNLYPKLPGNSQLSV